MSKRYSYFSLFIGMTLGLIIWLGQIPGGISSNDQIYNISSGFDLGQFPDLIETFKINSQEACQGARDCIKNQAVLASEMPLNYPVAGLTGIVLANNGIPENYTLFAFEATSRSIAIGFGLAFVLFLLISRYLSTSERGIIGTALIFGYGMTLLGAQKSLTINFMAFNRMETVGGLFLLTAFTALILHFYRDRFEFLTRRPTAFILAFLVVGFGLLSRGDNLPLAGAISIVLAIPSLTFLLHRVNFPLTTAFIIAVSLVMAVTSNYLLYPTAGIAPRSNGFFVAIPILLLALTRPNGFWPYLLPLLALFHLSSASLIIAMLFCAEAWMVIIRKGNKKNLFVYGILFLAIYGYTRLAFTGLAKDPMPIFEILNTLASIQFAAAVAFSLLLISCATWIAFNHSHRPGTARALILIAGVFLQFQISGHFNSVSMFEPGYYVITRSFVYNAPAILSASVLVILSELHLQSPKEASHPPSKLHAYLALVVLMIGVWNPIESSDNASIAEKMGLGIKALIDPQVLITDKYSMPYDQQLVIPLGENTATNTVKFLSYSKLRFKIRDNPDEAHSMTYKFISQN